MSFEIIRNAKVKAEYATKVVSEGRETRTIPQLKICINDRYEHTFTTARENRLMTEMDLDTISKMFSGGTFVFYDGVMRDYRDGSYRGFIHSDDSIARLSDAVGVTDYSTRRGARAVNGPMNHVMNGSSPRSSVFNRFRTNGNNGLFMGGEWDKFDLDIKELREGGSFENRLIFKYSVFSDSINASFETLRLVCTNGAVSMSEFLNYEVPMINNWQDNLNTAANRIKPEVNEIMAQRFLQMANDRATVREIQDINRLIERRIESVEAMGDLERLKELSALTNVERTLGKYYNADVFKSAKTRYLAGDLTQFDAYNILTETSSHTLGDENNDLSIQRLANHLMFDALKKEKTVVPVIPESIESDHRRAFFGEAA